jgi:hypothetical protein
MISGIVNHAKGGVGLEGGYFASDLFSELEVIHVIWAVSVGLHHPASLLTFSFENNKYLLVKCDTRQIKSNNNIYHNFYRINILQSPIELQDGAVKYSTAFSIKQQ